MPQRIRLTKQIVDRLIPPKTGEVWISDLSVRGFGIRLWSTKAGGQRSYAIRTVDLAGCTIRKAFNIEDSWRYRFYKKQGANVTLGDLLEEARKWARDEIDRLKGRLSIDEEEWIERRIVGDRIRKMALGKAAHSMISGMRINGRSETYVDRLDKLFANNVSKRLKATRLYRVSAEELAKSLVKTKTPAGNIRILRSFIGHIFEQAAWFHGPLLRLSGDLDKEFNERCERIRDVRFPELRKLTKDDFQSIFLALEERQDHWQSALCIRLFFEFGAPLSRVSAGQWAQLVEDRWYPYWPHEKVLWYESEERISEAGRRVLALIKKHVQKEFGGSKYWFPVKVKDAVHIKNVGSIWKTTLKRSGLRYYPLREFARSYRDPNCPSYLMSFLRQYGETFRNIGNVAELSKILNHQFQNAQNVGFSGCGR